MVGNIIVLYLIYHNEKQAYHVPIISRHCSFVLNHILNLLHLILVIVVKEEELLLLVLKLHLGLLDGLYPGIPLHGLVMPKLTF